MIVCGEKFISLPEEFCLYTRLLTHALINRDGPEVGLANYTRACPAIQPADERLLHAHYVMMILAMKS